MLDNSGSMAWDLSGNQLTSNSFLNRPEDINVDSKGNIYVWSTNNTVIEGKNYRMLVFNPDGTFKKAMIEYNQSGQAYFNQTCGKSYGSNPKFDIHDDQIYYLDSGFRTSIHVVDLNGNCIRTKQLDHQYCFVPLVYCFLLFQFVRLLLFYPLCCLNAKDQFYFV